MATPIDKLTHAAVLDENMRIPISLFGQTLYVTLGQILAAQNILTITEYSPDGLDGHWHAEYAATDNYIRISTDGGNTWGPAINLRDPEAQQTDSLYTWMKFADTTTPQTSADIYDEPRDTTTAIGWAYNKPTREESDNPADYTWVRVKGADAKEECRVQEYYAVSESGSKAPMLGWVEVPANDMPAMSKEKPYLWNKERTTYTNGECRDTTAKVIGRMGEDGTSITGVTDYYLATSKATGVKTTDSSWATDIEAAQADWGESKMWLWNYEKRSWSDGHTDEVKPHRIARWAKDGASGQGSVNSYVFCLSEKQPATPKGGSYTSLVPNGWSDGFPADPEDDNFGLSVWMSRRLFTSDGLPPQDPEWTEPALFGNNSQQQIMYSTADEQPPSPAVDESAWDDEACRDTVWMAMRHRVNSLKNPGWSDWSIIRIKGETGKDGVGITSQTVTYSTLNTEEQPADSTFTLSRVPTLMKGNWLWSKTEIKYSNGEISKTYGASRVGTDGTSVGIKSTSVTYAKTTSVTQPVDADFIHTSIEDTKIAAGEYLWTKSTTVYTDGKSMTSYSVSRIGSDGNVGTPGKAGADGRTPYLHIAYANSADGSSNFATSYFEDALYMGTYTDYNAADPTDYKLYKWSRLRGKDGVTVSNTSVRYSTANTASRPADSTFTLSDVPALSAGQYLWSRSTVTYSDGKATNAYAVSRVGADGLPGSGVTISSSSITYAKTKTNVQPADAYFTYSSITAAQVEKGDWLWSKQELRYSDGTITRGYTVSRIGSDGANGEGIPGTSNYIHYAYATSPDGVTGFSTAAYDDAVYIGVCVTDSEPDPTDPAAYEWSRFKGLTAVLDPNTHKWTYHADPSQLHISATLQKFEDMEHDTSQAVLEAATARQDATIAKNNSTTALSTANAANTNAQTAADKADKAQTTADSAKTTADTAKSTADTAKSTADKAQTTADTASSNASWALSTATQSSKDASTALNKATSVEKVANSANENATSALDKAVAALTTAESKASLTEALNEVKKLELSDFSKFGAQVATKNEVSDLEGKIPSTIESMEDAAYYVKIENRSSHFKDSMLYFSLTDSVDDDGVDHGLALGICGYPEGKDFSFGFCAQIDILTHNSLKGYATESWVNQQGFLKSASFANYLPLTGGTLDFGATLTNFNLNSTHASEVGMRFCLSNSAKGWLGYNNTYGVNLYNYASQAYLGLRDNGQAYVNHNMIWHAGNDGSGSGLDADLLDGVHNGSLTAAYTHNGGIRCNRMLYKNDNYGYPTYFILADVTSTATVDAEGTHYGFVGTIYHVRNSGYSIGEAVHVVAKIGYSKSSYQLTSSSESIMPCILQNGSRYYLALRVIGSGHEYYLHGYEININTTISQILCTDYRGALPSGYSIKIKGNGCGVWGNANTATQLQTARTIWGQSFNGTGNIDGLLKIQANAGNYCEGIRIKPNANWCTILLGGSDLTADYGTSAKTWSIHNNDGNFYINNNASNNQKATRLWGHANGWTVGNTNTSVFALNASTFYCDDWIRTGGAHGWYSQTYGSGLYMIDSSWIRIYGPANFYANAAIIRTDGTLQVGDNGKWFLANSSGATVFGNTVWHAGNFDPEDYLPLSGGSITGNLTVSNALTVNGNISSQSSVILSGAAGRKFTFNTDGVKAAARADNGGSVVQFAAYKSDNTTLLGAACGAFINANALQYCYYGGSWDAPKMVIMPSGDVGINTTTPTGGCFHLRKHLLVANANAYFNSSNDGSGSGAIMAWVNNALVVMAGASRSWVRDIAKFHYDGSMTVTGTCTAKSHANSSDIRLKNILGYLTLDVSTIAAAPSVRFSWKDSPGVFVGTIAQYWLAKCPEAVNTGHDGFYGVQYDALALISAISIARKVVSHDDRITTLERENTQLKTRISQLESQLKTA